VGDLHALGLLPILASVAEPESIGLPARAIRDQGDLNCCLSCAIAAAIEGGDPASPALAPLYHFHFARDAFASDAGITLAEARGALFSRGVCALSLHSLAIARANAGIRPSAAAIEDGLRRRPMDAGTGTLRWAPVPIAGPSPLKRRLLAGAPVVLAIQPNDDYFALTAAAPILAGNGPPYSVTGHAAAVVGYRNTDAVFVVQDSRGPSFGLGGQWFLPYDLLDSPFVVSAFALSPE
jgi:hypothetical protein